MTNLIRLTSYVPDEDVDALRARLVGEDHFDYLLSGEDADVLRPDGSPLVVFRSGSLPLGVCRDAYPALVRAAVPSHNRGDAAGGRRRRRKRDGTRSNTGESRPFLSGLLGFYDRNARDPYCRKTAYTARDVEGWASVLPFVRAVNEVFRRELPDRYAAQMRAVERTHPAYVIRGTAFTTVTVNRNFRTRVHKDEGDLNEGFGVMSPIDRGSYGGGFLVFPKWRVGVDMRAGDVCLADVHEWHGNTAIEGVEGEYDRVSCVFYYRTNMGDCLPPREELRRLASRRPGDPLK